MYCRTGFYVHNFFLIYIFVNLICFWLDDRYSIFVYIFDLIFTLAYFCKTCSLIDLIDFILFNINLVLPL